MTTLLSNDDFDFRRAWCRRVLAIGMLLLIAATRPLWFSLGEFPQVPWFEFLCPTPQWVDWCLSIVMVASLLAMATVRTGTKWNQIAGATMIGSLFGLLLLNQHRLQPWAWFVLLGTLATSARSDYSLRWLRWLFFGVYFFSGLSKLEPSFIGGGGDWLLYGMMRPFGGSPDALTRGGREFLLQLLPIGEMLAACCVVIPRFRRFAMFLVLAMHGALILALGPFGLNHQPGVLIWNGVFQALAFPMLWHRNATKQTEGCRRSRHLGAVVVAMAVVLPCFGQRWLPIVDQWPSWSVYATWQNHKVGLVFLGDTPAMLKGARGLWTMDSGGRQPLVMTQWSLETTGSPLYPSDRFRTGVRSVFANWPNVEMSPAESEDQYWFGTTARPFEVPPDRVRRGDIPGLLGGFLGSGEDAREPPR